MKAAGRSTTGDRGLEGVARPGVGVEARPGKDHTHQAARKATSEVPSPNPTTRLGGVEGSPDEVYLPDKSELQVRYRVVEVRAVNTG